MDDDIPKFKPRSSIAPNGTHERIRRISASSVALTDIEKEKERDREKESDKDPESDKDEKKDFSDKKETEKKKKDDVRIDIARREAENEVEITEANRIKTQAQKDRDNDILSVLYRRMFCASSIHYATALNILAVYMKGQKMIHIEAKEHHEYRLNCLMLPAIVNSAACTVLSTVLTGTTGTIILSSLTAFNSCVLAVISYLKLDAKAEAHKSSAYQYDKLQSLCEFHAGKFLFFETDEESQRFYKIMTEIETKVKEIKDANQFVLPEEVRRKYPTIYTTNVFSEVKRLQNKESIECAKYIKMVQKNESEDKLHEQIELIVSFKSNYLKLDEDFNNEMNNSSSCSCFRTNPIVKHDLNTI